MLLIIYYSHFANFNSDSYRQKIRTVLDLKLIFSLLCILHSPIKLVITWFRNISLLLQKALQQCINKSYRKVHFISLFLFSSSKRRFVTVGNIAYCRNFLFIKITLLFYFPVYLNTFQYLVVNAIKTYNIVKNVVNESKLYIVMHHYNRKATKHIVI